MATKFLEKNKIDLDLGANGAPGAPTITITDSVATDTGQAYVDYMRNRDNDSGWGTTGSADIARTIIDVQIGDTKDLDTIILTGINWAEFTAQYWNGNAFVDFISASGPSGLYTDALHANLNFINAQIAFSSVVSIASTATPWAVTAWLRCTQYNGGWQIRNATGSQIYFTFIPEDGIPNNANIQIDVDGSHVFSATLAFTNDLFGWHHYAVTYDGAGNVNLYIDGVLQTLVVGSNTLGGSTSFVNSPFALTLSGGEWQTVGIYNSDLNSTQVGEIVTATQNADLTGLSSSGNLTHAYPLNGNSSDSVASANGVDTNMTYVGGSLFPGFYTELSDSVFWAQFTKVTTNWVRFKIYGCQGAQDIDKLCAQIILTLSIGTLQIEPAFVSPLISKNRRPVKQISGKYKVQQSAGGIEMQLQQNNVVSDADLTLQEALFAYVSGFLIWPSGGTTSQFPTQRIGFRPQDIYLVKPTNEYQPEWEDGRYKNGIPINMQLVEIA